MLLSEKIAALIAEADRLMQESEDDTWTPASQAIFAARANAYYAKAQLLYLMLAQPCGKVIESGKVPTPPEDAA